MHLQSNARGGNLEIPYYAVNSHSKSPFVVRTSPTAATEPAQWRTGFCNKTPATDANQTSLGGVSLSNQPAAAAGDFRDPSREGCCRKPLAGRHLHAVSVVLNL